MRVPPVGFLGAGGFEEVEDEDEERLLEDEDDRGLGFGFSSGGSPVSWARAGADFFGGVLPRLATPSEEGCLAATGSLASGAKKKATNTAVHTNIIRPKTTT